MTTRRDADLRRDVDRRRLADQRRRRRRRLLFLLLLAAAVAAAILYLRCGDGWGLGKGGGAGIGVHDDTGEGQGEAKTAVTLPDAGIPRCQLRIDANGTTVDGRPASIEEAVVACKKGGADVVVTGDARQGDWDALRARLEAEGIPTFVKGAPETAPADAK